MQAYAPNALEPFWMPFTNNRHFKQEPRLLARAQGMYYWKPGGERVLDGTAGLWCSNAGHCHPRIVEAIREQAGELDFAPMFQLGHPLAFTLASRLAQEMPDGIDHIFFTNSGSEAVDSALKIALAYQRAIGQGGRTRLIGRERGYHGTNFGGTAVGGIVGNRRAFGALVAGVDHLPHTHQPHRNAHARGRPPHGADLADALERLIGLHGADTIAAVIVEPVAGSTGVLPPPVGYLERLRAITAANGILLIFDEVITGFGRMGTLTAAEAFGVTPDLITLAKGITNAAVPMGAVAVTGAVYNAVVQNAAPGIELATGYTYSGHPLACAAALAALDVYHDEGLFTRAAALQPYWVDAVHSLADARHVVDVRECGIIAGIELAAREGAPGARAMAAFHRLFDTGTLVRVTGETIALSPPLIISEEQIDTLVGAIRGVLADTD